MSKQMLIDALHPEETRVVVLENGRVEELDVDTQNKKQIKGIDVDAVTSASVSTSNITSCIKSLFEYHVNKYYADKIAN